MKEQKKWQIAMLGHYYDLPDLIKDELQQVRRYMGETEPIIVTVRESCQKRANALIAERDKVRAALEQLDPSELKILELAYLGPKDAEAREKWTRRPSWKEICAQIGFSDAECDGGWARKKAAIVMDKLCKILF